MLYLYATTHYKTGKWIFHLIFRLEQDFETEQGILLLGQQNIVIFYLAGIKNFLLLRVFYICIDTESEVPFIRLLLVFELFNCKIPINFSMRKNRGVSYIAYKRLILYLLTSIVLCGRGGGLCSTLLSYITLYFSRPCTSKALPGRVSITSNK